MSNFLKIREVNHENLNIFVGACVEPPNICIIWQYCSKGSLRVSKRVDRMFILS